MKRFKEDNCSSCGKHGPIAYVKEMLCSNCNRYRHSINYANNSIHKRRQYQLKRTPIKISKNRGKSIKEDNEFYELVWKMKAHYCEECGNYLSKKLNKSYISHIISKGSYNAFRHDIRNVNVLCFACHQTWEFGDRTTMKIKKKNDIIVSELKRDYHST